GVISVGELLQAANEALAAAARSAWVLLDRLDVAFAESSDLEHNALRALFRVYLDLLALEQIRLKIFLRTDIWRRITAAGFREASHITRHLTIDWNARSLLNLVVSRAIQNDELQRFYSTTRQAVLTSADSQREFFYRMCPDQVDVGPNKPSTFDWMLGRTRDGLGTNAPRELIHLLNSLREVQVRRLETGDAEPDGGLLFARTSFKEALPEVSRVRLEQTLFAEYPALRHSLEKLRGAKTLHTVDTLSELWGIDPGQAQKQADELVEVGFVERRGTRERPEYWVPFLYRDALDLVQGAAE
ncbi:MAG: P-loop ATPase, Sll1717 family, partial [bacterium]